MASRAAAGLACSCSQPCSPRSCLGTGSVALAEQAERLSVDRVALTSVHRQSRRWDGAVSSKPFDVIGHPTGPYGLGLTGVAQHPDRPARAGVHRGEDGFDLMSRGLGDLVEHDNGARCERPVGQVDPQPGDSPGVQAGARQLGYRLGRRRHRHDRAAVSCHGAGGGMEHRRLAVPSRCQHRP